jgi:hypothetical protein
MRRYDSSSESVVWSECWTSVCTSLNGSILSRLSEPPPPLSLALIMSEQPTARPSRRDYIANKRRTQARSRWRATNAKVIAEAPDTFIFRLPIELLAETLSRLLPIDLLAIARTCKYFADILLTSTSAYMWKVARKNFPFRAIPDPTSNWTESALAALLFDNHVCAVSGFPIRIHDRSVGLQVCSRKVHTPPVSFALRKWLCDKVHLNLSASLLKDMSLVDGV